MHSEEFYLFEIWIWNVFKERYVNGSCLLEKESNWDFRSPKPARQPWRYYDCSIVLLKYNPRLYAAQIQSVNIWDAFYAFGSYEVISTKHAALHQSPPVLTQPKHRMGSRPDFASTVYKTTRTQTATKPVCSSEISFDFIYCHSNSLCMQVKTTRKNYICFTSYFQKCKKLAICSVDQMTDNTISLFPPPVLQRDYAFYAMPWLNTALSVLATPTSPPNPPNKGTNY